MSTIPSMPAANGRTTVDRQLSAEVDDLRRRVDAGDISAAELAREVRALCTRMDEAERRFEPLEVAASRARVGDEEQGKTIAELREIVDALRTHPADVGTVLGEATRTLAEVRAAATRSPWAVAMGAGMLSAALGHAGSCAATREVAMDAAAEAVRTAPPPREFVIMTAPSEEPIDAGTDDRE